MTMTTHTVHPTWCERAEDCNGEHWRHEPYVAASRSRVVSAGPEGAILPAVGISIHQWRNQGPDISMHVTAETGDKAAIQESIDFSIEDAIDLAGNLLASIRAALDGGPSGLIAPQVLRLEEETNAILAAHNRTEAGKS